MPRLRNILLLGATALACDRPTSTPVAKTDAGSAQPSAASTPRIFVKPAVRNAAAKAAAIAPAKNPLDERRISFDGEPFGAPSKEFENIVSDWYVADAGGGHGLRVDGSKWRKGTASASLGEQAHRLYGERYTEFVKGVKPFAFYPFAVWKGEPPAGDIKISIRFFPIAGHADQAAGIAFAISPNGTYFGVRASALENDLVLFRIVKGKQTVLHGVRDIPTPTKTWHTLTLELSGNQVRVELDRKKGFEKTLDAAPTGRIGLWSNADSEVLFDSFTVSGAKLGNR